MLDDDTSHLPAVCYHSHALIGVDRDLPISAPFGKCSRKGRVACRHPERQGLGEDVGIDPAVVASGAEADRTQEAGSEVGPAARW